MKSMYHFSLLISVTLLFFGCGKSKDSCEDDQLSIPKSAYSGSEMRIDGFYFGEPYSDNDVPIYYFYEDGVFFDANAQPLESAIENSISVDVENKFAKEVKRVWGTFRVTSNTVEIERWRPMIQGCFTTIYERGNILNDTTFVLTKREYRDGGSVIEEETMSELFQFRPLEQKPDNTNPFIQ